MVILYCNGLFIGYQYTLSISRLKLAFSYIICRNIRINISRYLSSLSNITWQFISAGTPIIESECLSYKRHVVNLYYLYYDYNIIHIECDHIKKLFLYSKSGR